MKTFMVIASLGVLLSAAPATAVAPAAAPLFAVPASDNSMTRSDPLSAEERWVICYISGEGFQREEMLRILKALPRHAVSSGRIVVIVAGVAAEELQSWLGKQEGASTFVWRADPEWEAYGEIGLKGTPVALGVSDGVIRWSLEGNLRNSRAMRSMLLGWIGRVHGGDLEGGQAEGGDQEEGDDIGKSIHQW